MCVCVWHPCVSFKGNKIKHNQTQMLVNIAPQFSFPYTNYPILLSLSTFRIWIYFFFPSLLSLSIIPLPTTTIYRSWEIGKLLGLAGGRLIFLLALNCPVLGIHSGSPVIRRGYSSNHLSILSFLFPCHFHKMGFIN